MLVFLRKRKLFKIVNCKPEIKSRFKVYNEMDVIFHI